MTRRFRSPFHDERCGPPESRKGSMRHDPVPDEDRTLSIQMPFAVLLGNINRQLKHPHVFGMLERWVTYVSGREPDRVCEGTGRVEEKEGEQNER